MNRRDFHFIEGTSSKFWAVSVNDSTMTVQFGKIGTAGQTQEKAFPDEGAARKAADKLIAEKTGKGYVEINDTSPPAAAPEPTDKRAGPTPVSTRKRTNAATSTSGPTATPELPASHEKHAPAAPPRGINLPPVAPRTPAPAPRPLDLSALKKLITGITDYHALAPSLPPCTPEEARFWLYAYSYVGGLRSIYDQEAKIKALTLKKLQEPITLAQLKAELEGLQYWEVSLPILRLQASWMQPADLVEAVTALQLARLNSEVGLEMAAWLEAEVFPRLDAAAMEAVRERLRKLLKGEEREVSMLAAILARDAGMDADLAAHFAGLKKAALPSARDTTGWAAALFGIKDRAQLIKEFRRLGLRLGSPADARSWLALTGHDALDILRDSILAQRKAADQLALLDLLLLAESPEAAVALLEVKLQARPPEAGARIDAWLKKHFGHAAAGLTPFSGEKTPLGEAARVWLGSAGGAPPAAPPGDGSWLPDALASVKPAKKVPPFAEPAVLPPIPGLGAEDVSRVLAALQASTLTGPHPLVSALRRNGDKPALAAFAWTLFEGWVASGAPSKEKWAFLSLGHFGDDAAVMRLAPMIRAWPGESQHQRAVTGLEVLGSIGTGTALMQLNAMALKLKFKALQDRARGLMDLIASDRGLSREQLEDRIVPDLGFDADGERQFEFGTRTFRFTLDADLCPAIRDESGKALKDLPKPGTKDDAPRAEAAAAEWKLLKSQLRNALKVQTFRLEEAMIAGRAWPLEEFDTLLVRHPFMGLLVRRLLWAGQDASGATPRHFRINEKREWINHDGRAVDTKGITAVRLAHRLRMTPGQLSSWRSAFEALDLNPPFPQLDRTVHAVPAADANENTFVHPTWAIPATKMRGTLEERGWRRVMHDQGGIVGFAKTYPASGVTCAVMITPWILIGMQDNDDQRVEAAYFIQGVECPHGPCSDGHYEEADRLRLADVDAVAFSETMRDLASMLPRGKG